MNTGQKKIKNKITVIIIIIYNAINIKKKTVRSVVISLVCVCVCVFCLLKINTGERRMVGYIQKVYMCARVGNEPSLN